MACTCHIRASSSTVRKGHLTTRSAAGAAAEAGWLEKPQCGPVCCSDLLCGGLVGKRPKRLGFWKELWRVASEPVDLQAAQDPVFFIDEDTAQRLPVAKQEIRYRMHARCRLGLASNLKINAGTPALAPPGCNLSKFELRQERGRVGATVFEHPANKTPFVLREFAVNVAH